MIVKKTSLALFALAMFSGHASADDAELAKQLSNPIASLVSVPFQLNFDGGYGSDDGSRQVLNIQPVVPFSLNEDWNLISRTIVPVVWQNDVSGFSGDQFGFGDITQSFFFSPAKPTESGITWGVGPAFLLPTATDERLGAEKWGVGPTGVALKQDGRWTYGVLANHIWSVAGDSNRGDISNTFLQPFVSYTTPDAWTFSVNTESTFDWKADEWSVPINVGLSKLVKFGEQPVSLSASVRYWAAAPENGPEGWGGRVGITFLFPK